MDTAVAFLLLAIQAFLFVVCLNLISNNQKVDEKRFERLQDELNYIIHEQQRREFHYCIEIETGPYCP